MIDDIFIRYCVYFILGSVSLFFIIPVFLTLLGMCLVSFPFIAASLMILKENVTVFLARLFKCKK